MERASRTARHFGSTSNDMQAGEQQVHAFYIFECEMRARKDDPSVREQAFSQFALKVHRLRSYVGDLKITPPDISSRSIFIDQLNVYKEHPLRKSLWTEVYIPFQTDVCEQVVPGQPIDDPLSIVQPHIGRLDRWFQSWFISAPWFMDDIESSIGGWLISVLAYGKNLTKEDFPYLNCLPEDPVMPKEFNPVFQDPYPIISNLDSAKMFRALMKICEMVPDPYPRNVCIRGIESSFVTRLESPEHFERRMRKQFDGALREFTAEYERHYVERTFVVRDADWSVRRIAGQTIREIADAAAVHENADPEQTVKKAIERFAVEKLGLGRRMLTAARKRKVQE